MRHADGPRARFVATQTRKERDRDRRIDRLVEEARAKGGLEDRFYWTLVHDHELAPTTTNRAQLRELGIEPPAPDAVAAMDDDAVHAMLWSLIDALALLRCYLSGTEHLDDRAMLERLLGRLIDEPIRDLPVASGIMCFIDLRLDDPDAPIDPDPLLEDDPLARLAGPAPGDRARRDGVGRDERLPRE